MAELGSTGGYSLPPDYSLPPLALTLHEALLLRLALSSLSQLGDVPFKGERESLLLKIQTLLPRHERVNLEQLQQAVSLDVPSSRSYPTPFLDRLLKSAQEECWVSVSYCSEKGVSQQTLLPLRLRTTAGLWYCEAYSYERQATRVYRVDRFLEVKAAMEPPELERPATPILHVDSSYPEVHIFLTARGMLRLEHEPHLGPRLQRTEAGDGWLRLQLRPEEYDWLVSIVLGLGTDAKVLAPEELRLRVQQVVHEIAHNYAEL